MVNWVEINREKIFRIIFLTLIVGFAAQTYVMATTTYNLGGSVTIASPNLAFISATINNQACALAGSTITCPNIALQITQTVGIHIVLNNDALTQMTLTIFANSTNTMILTITNTGLNTLTLRPNEGADLNFNLQAVGAGNAGYSIIISA